VKKEKKRRHCRRSHLRKKKSVSSPLFPSCVTERKKVKFIFFTAGVISSYPSSIKEEEGDEEEFEEEFEEEEGPREHASAAAPRGISEPKPLPAPQPTSALQTRTLRGGGGGGEGAEEEEEEEELEEEEEEEATQREARCLEVGASSTKLHPVEEEEEEEEEEEGSSPCPSLNRISLGPSAISGLAAAAAAEEALEPPPLGIGSPGTAASSAERGEEFEEEEQLTSSNSAPLSPEPETPPIPFPVALRAASFSVHSALNSASLRDPSGRAASASASAGANFFRAKGREPRRGERAQSSASSPTAWPGAETATPSSPSVWVTLNSRREQAGEVEEEISSPPSSSVVEVELTSSGFPLPPLLSGRPEG